MHGLIFETSVWLLAESTRLLNIKHCHTRAANSTNLQSKTRRAAGKTEVNDKSNTLSTTYQQRRIGEGTTLRATSSSERGQVKYWDNICKTVIIITVRDRMKRPSWTDSSNRQWVFGPSPQSDCKPSSPTAARLVLQFPAKANTDKPHSLIRYPVAIWSRDTICIAK